MLKILPPEPAVSGRIRGRPARLHAFTRGTGKSRTHWVAARLECIDAGPLKLSMRTQGPALYEKLAGAFGYKDVVTGDAVFDRTFAVHGNDEAFVKAALIPEVRQKLVAFWPRARAGRFVIESGDAVYEERGSFTSRRTRENIEKAFGVLGDLAAIAEVYKR